MKRSTLRWRLSNWREESGDGDHMGGGGLVGPGGASPPDGWKHPLKVLKDFTRQTLFIF